MFVVNMHVLTHVSSCHALLLLCIILTSRITHKQIPAMISDVKTRGTWNVAIVGQGVNLDSVTLGGHAMYS